MGATFVVQPLDLLKNRLQMTGEGGEKRMYKNTIDAFMKIGRAEGVIGMWNGISAGLLRQATYTTTRLGIFSTLQDKFVAREGRNPSLLVKVGSCLFVCLFVVVFLFACLYVYWYAYWFVYLFDYWFVCLFICLLVCLFVYAFLSFSL